MAPPPGGARRDGGSAGLLRDNLIRGNVSGGYMLTARVLADWDDDLCETGLAPRMVFAYRQDCAPDCGP